MGELGQGLGFPFEAFEELGGFLAQGLDHLECDLAVQAGVEGPIDGGHPPFAELLQDVVAANRLSDHGAFRLSVFMRSPVKAGAAAFIVAQCQHRLWTNATLMKLNGSISDGGDASALAPIHEGGHRMDGDSPGGGVDGLHQPLSPEICAPEGPILPRASLICSL